MSARRRTSLRRCPVCGALRCRHPERIPLANPKHRKNPRRFTARRAMIPGDVTEIRYRRTGSQPGMYYHPFKGGVKMIANADGSVTLRGRERIHGNDRERGFWERYGHGRKRMASNPGKLFGMDPLTLGLVALGGYLLYQWMNAPPASAGLWAGSSPTGYESYREGERDLTSTAPVSNGEIALTGDVPEWYGVPI